MFPNLAFAAGERWQFRGAGGASSAESTAQSAGNGNNGNGASGSSGANGSAANGNGGGASHAGRSGHRFKRVGTSDVAGTGKGGSNTMGTADQPPRQNGELRRKQ